MYEGGQSNGQTQSRLRTLDIFSQAPVHPFAAQIRIFSDGRKNLVPFLFTYLGRYFWLLANDAHL